MCKVYALEAKLLWSYDQPMAVRLASNYIITMSAEGISQTTGIILAMLKIP